MNATNQSFAIFPDASPAGSPALMIAQQAFLDATPDCIKLVTTDGRLQMMNRAGRVALGVPEGTPLGMVWLSLLPEGVRAAGAEALRKAAAGEPARFAGRSEGQGPVVYWDNLLTPVRDGEGTVIAILCVSRDVTEKVTLEQAVSEAVDRQELITGEMRHRIKNLFSVVSSLISISEKEASRAGAPAQATRILRERLEALLRASDCTFADEALVAAGELTVSLPAIARAVLQPYGGKCRVNGADVRISRAHMTTLALFLHELATNSVKHGALGTEKGTVSVTWTCVGDLLHLRWRERGGPEIAGPPARLGFGTQMVDRIVEASRGAIARDWAREGLSVRLELPAMTQPHAA